MTTLRPYQSQAIEAVLDYWGNGGGNPLVAMATYRQPDMFVERAPVPVQETFL
jgi:hypothetical protein